jgi:hypothetical protein
LPRGRPLRRRTCAFDFNAVTDLASIAVSGLRRTE